MNLYSFSKKKDLVILLAMDKSLLALHASYYKVVDNVTRRHTMLARKLNRSVKIAHALANSERTHVNIHHFDWHMYVIVSIKLICVIRKAKSIKKILVVIKDTTKIK